MISLLRDCRCDDHLQCNHLEAPSAFIFHHHCVHLYISISIGPVLFRMALIVVMFNSTVKHIPHGTLVSGNVAPPHSNGALCWHKEFSINSQKSASCSGKRKRKGKKDKSTIIDMINQFIHEHTRTVIEYISIFVA